VIETVVVPLLKAQKSPDVDEGVVCPLLSTCGKRDPDPDGTTKSPIVGSELAKRNEGWMHGRPPQSGAGIST
jgi:hypothetical protein